MLPETKLMSNMQWTKPSLKFRYTKKTFFLTKGTFLMDRNNLINTNQVVTEITKIYIIKQNRVTVISNREKFTKRNGKRNLPRVISLKVGNDDNKLLCFVNRTIISSCDFCGCNQSDEKISNCNKKTQCRKEYCEYIVSKNNKGNIHLIIYKT